MLIRRGVRHHTVELSTPPMDKLGGAAMWEVGRWRYAAMQAKTSLAHQSSIIELDVLEALETVEKHRLLFVE